MEFLTSQLNGFNVLKDIAIPMLAAWVGFWLAGRKFKKERLWQEKYAAYQQVLAAIEAISLWAEESCNGTRMLPTIGWFDGKTSTDFYSQARREIAKHARIGMLLLSSETISTLEDFQRDIFRENFRAEDESDHSDNPSEIEDEFHAHAQEIRKIVDNYLPRITLLARKDLGT